MPSREAMRPALTVREYVMLYAAASGLGVAETARELGRPPEEVRAALGSAIAKLGARSKLEAVVIAIRLGLIDLDRVAGSEGPPRSGVAPRA